MSAPGGLRGPKPGFARHKKYMNFSDLGLNDNILRAVDDAGYSTPTPIQEQAIPYVLMGRDVLACAQTGTGKTASFTLPMIEILSQGRAKARMPRTLILEPTRELAAQVAENFETYGKYHKLSKALLIGGQNMGEQMKTLDRGVDVLIATPGRLLDMFERGKILMNDVKILVIDEADRMLDMGFIPDVERIVGLISPIRQTLFFSATMAPEIKKLADKFLMNPKEVTVSKPATTADTIEQGLMMLRPSGRRDDIAKIKRDGLRALIDSEEVKDALIFCNRKVDVNIVYKSLIKHGLPAGQLHGDMTQPARMDMLAKFKAGEVTYLVCSDVAARGLDIPALSHVFNFDVPNNAEDYVHRIGRTGRAGRKGHAYTIAVPSDARYIDGVEKLIGQPIPRITRDGIDTLTPEEETSYAEDAAERGGRGGRGGGRNGRGGTKSGNGGGDKGGEKKDASRSRSRGGRNRKPAPDTTAAPSGDAPAKAQAQPKDTSSGKSKDASKGGSKGRPRKQDGGGRGGNDAALGAHNMPAFLQTEPLPKEKEKTKPKAKAKTGSEN